MPTTLTPLRYPGGKSKYVPLFKDILGLNEMEGCTFVEPFAGGAGAAISLLLKGYVESLILNDLDIRYSPSGSQPPKKVLGVYHCILCEDGSPSVEVD